MDFRPYIITDPNILLGKPVIKGTRIPVEFILKKLSEEMTEIQIIEDILL